MIPILKKIPLVMLIINRLLSYAFDRVSDIQIVSFSNRRKKGLFEKLSRL